LAIQGNRRLDHHHHQQVRLPRHADPVAEAVSMSAALDQPTAERLAKLLGMCGSAHAGERAAAAAKADQLVRSLNLTWHEVIMAPPIVPTETVEWREMAEFCHARRARLRLRDREFIESILQSRRDDLTEKQSGWLADIHTRLSSSETRQ
jgi:hypothetical protein